MIETAVPQGFIHLAPGHFLQWDEAQQTHVLIHTEGTLPLNARENEILKRCNGSLTAEGIIEQVQQQFPGVDIASDVRDFLKAAYANNWIHGQ